jgi:hypothetical protein
MQLCITSTAQDYFHVPPPACTNLASSGATWTIPNPTGFSLANFFLSLMVIARLIYVSLTYQCEHVVYPPVLCTGGKI